MTVSTGMLLAYGRFVIALLIGDLHSAAIRDGLFDIRGGGVWNFFEKNSLFPYRGEKIKCFQRS